MTQLRLFGPTAALTLTLLYACNHATPAPRHATGDDDRRPGAAAFSHARARLVAGDTLRAEQYALLAMRRGYPEDRLIGTLVQACLASSRLRAALVYAEPFLRRHPEQVRLRLLVATVQLGLGHAAAAERELQRVSARRPELAETYYLGGVIARDAFGDPAEARTRFEHYLALAPHGEHAPELVAWLSEQPQAAPTDVVPSTTEAE